MATLDAFHGQSMGCSRWEEGEGQVSGALKRDYLAKGVNSGRKSVVLQHVGGLGLRLTYSASKNFEVEKLNKTIKCLGSGQGPKLGCRAIRSSIDMGYHY
jgi:hypothetical protein